MRTADLLLGLIAFASASVAGPVSIRSNSAGLTSDLLHGAGGWSPGGGLTFGGSYSGGTWNLHFNLNSGFGGNCGPGGCGTGWFGGSGWYGSSVWYGPRAPRYDWYAVPAHQWYWDGYGWKLSSSASPYAPLQLIAGHGRYGVDGMQVRYDPVLLPGVSSNGQPDPNDAPPPPPPPPTTLESAHAAMRDGKYDEARRLLTEHLRTDADDADSLRLLGVVLIGSKEVETGAAVIRSAYVKDPLLADVPMERETTGLTRERLREFVGRAVQHAHKAKSASSWLAVAVLMHAEGRSSNAKAMVARAREAGLEREVADALTAALAPAPNASKKVEKPIDKPVDKPAIPAATSGVQASASTPVPTTPAK